MTAETIETKTTDNTVTVATDLAILTPAAIAKRTFTCEICGNDYIYTGSYDLYYYRNKCHKLCTTCFATLPGKGKYIHNCKCCHALFLTTGTTTFYCPTCNEEKKTFTCIICGKNYFNENARLDRKNICICPSCKETLPGEGSIVNFCKLCDVIFLANGANYSYCPTCEVKVKSVTCMICGKEYIDPKVNINDDEASKQNKICPTCKTTLPGEGHVINFCKLCNAPFLGANNHCYYCPTCRADIKSVTCIVCGKDYIDPLVKIGDDSTERNKICSSCRATLPGTGGTINFCKSCNTPFLDTNNKACYCPTCSKDVKGFTCIVCGKESIHKTLQEKIDICQACRATLPGDGNMINFCKLCNKPFLGNCSRVSYCPTCKVTHKIYDCILCSESYIDNRCKVKGRKEPVRICPECQKTLPGYGEYKSLITCDACSIPFFGQPSSNQLCPTCYKETHSFTCVLCGNEYSYTGKNLERYRANGVKVCSSCHDALPGEGRITAICNTCHCIFRTKAAVNIYFCPTCREDSQTSESVKRCRDLINAGLEMIDSPAHDGYIILCEDIPERKTGIDKNCVLCGRKFKKLRTQTCCMHCYRIQTCQYCGKDFVNADHHRLDINRFCSISCTTSAQWAKGKGKVIPLEIIATDLTLPHYEALNVTIDDTTLPDLNVAGVWALYSEDDILLDVAQTCNIAAEWKVLPFKFNRPKFLTMSTNGINLSTLKGVVITYENSVVNRLKIEEDYAKTHGAKYWHPQLGTFQCY